MTQRRRIQNGVVMLVTTNVVRRAPFFEDDAHAREAVEQLYRVRQRIPFDLFGFVIMPDHCPILLRVLSPHTVSEVMRTYKMGLTFQIGAGPFWQPRFHVSIPQNSLVALEYVHNNPVKAGFVGIPSEYPWSSACDEWEVTPLDC